MQGVRRVRGRGAPGRLAVAVRRLPGVTGDVDYDAGRPIYARMGYDTIATHTAFIEKCFLEGH